MWLPLSTITNSSCSDSARNFFLGLENENQDGSWTDERELNKNWLTQGQFKHKWKIVLFGFGLKCHRAQRGLTKYQVFTIINACIFNEIGLPLIRNGLNGVCQSTFGWRGWIVALFPRRDPKLSQYKTGTVPTTITCDKTYLSHIASCLMALLCFSRNNRDHRFPNHFPWFSSIATPFSFGNKMI